MKYYVFLAVWNGEPCRLQFGCEMANKVRDRLIGKNIPVTTIVETETQFQRTAHESALAHRLIVYALGE